MGYAPTHFRSLLFTALFFLLSGTAFAQYTINCTPGTPATTSTTTDGSVNIALTAFGQASGSATLTLTRTDGEPVISIPVTTFPAILNLTSLQGGAYIGIISDGQNSASCNFVIGVANCGLTATVNPISRVLNCQGDMGSITATAMGGTPPYTYSWPGNRIGATINVGTGIWIVTITDDAGCTATATATHTAPQPLFIDCNSPMAATNLQIANGSIAVSVSGGQFPYDLMLKDLNGQEMINLPLPNPTSIVLDGFSAGKYILNITDAAGCQNQCEVIVDVQNCDLNVSFPAINLSCSNESTTLTPVITGGLPPYEYLWDDGSMEFTRIVAANTTSSVTVTDQTGCVRSNSITVNAPQTLQVFCSNIRNATITGATDGAVDFVINGGSAPFTYLVERAGLSYASGNIVFGVNNFTIVTFEAGNYNVIISDNNGCTDNCNFTITEPTCNMTITLPDVQLDCKGDNDGVLQPKVTGGTPPYRYQWQGGIPTPTRQNLGVGTYYLSVTDVNNCRKTATVNIIEPDALFLTADVIEQGSITGAPTGAATFTFGGGTSPLTYSLSSNNQMVNGGAGGTVNLDQLVAGDYIFTVVDANNCTLNTPISIYPCALDVDIVVDRPLCMGSSDAVIDLTITGAIGTVIYDWDNDQFDGQSRLEGLIPGTYRVTINDLGTECYINRTIVIPESESQGLFVDFTVLEQGTNFGSEIGAVSVSFGGGLAPLTYQFGNNPAVEFAGDGTVEFSELTAGTYMFTLTDVNGCTRVRTIDIFPCGLQLDIDVEPVSCVGNNDGSVQITVTNNTGALDFDWADDKFDGQSSISDLTPETYTVTITDQANNCSIEQAIIISTSNVRIELSCSTDIINDQAYVNYEIANGTPPYQVTIVGTGVQRSHFFEGSFSLSFPANTGAELLVVDANGCQSSCALSGNSSTGGCIDFSAIAFFNQNLSTDLLAGVEAIAVGGTLPYMYLWSNGRTGRIIKVPYGSNLSVEIIDGAGCRKTGTVQVPAAPITDIDEEEVEEEEVEEEEEETNSNPSTYPATCVNDCDARGQGENYINKIEIGRSTLNSGDNDGFRYFPSAFFNFQSEGIYTLRINAMSNEIPTDSLYWYIWMDINRDGDFEDEGETLLEEKATYELMTEINFPFIEHRNTVCTRFAISTEPVTACEDVTNGEVEDYLFIVNTNRFQPPNLKGERDQNLIRVEWFPLPDSDEQTERYVIEKSIDNQSFTPMSEIESFPTTIHELKDSKPIVGDNYYRLITFRVGGEVYFSDVIQVKYQLDETSIQVFPVPAQRHTLLHLPMENPEVVMIKIYNQLGEKMHQEEVQFQPGTLIPLDVSQLTNGLYIVQVETEQRKQQIAKLIVERSE